MSGRTEWLTSTSRILSGFQDSAGLGGIKALYFALSALIFCGVYYRACRAGAECEDAALAYYPGESLRYCVARLPVRCSFGWLCMIGLLLILDRFQQSGKGIWLVPPLFTLWINLHGSWLFGMIVLVIVIASGFVEGVWGSVIAQRWASGERKKLVGTLAASIAALFCESLRLQAKLPLLSFDLLLRQKNAMQAAVQECSNPWTSVRAAASS